MKINMNDLFKKKQSDLDLEIERLMKDLATLPTDSKDYDNTIKALETLIKLKDVNTKYKKRLDPNQLLAVLGSLGGIMAVLNYEQLSVITGKAWGLVNKVKL